MCKVAIVGHGNVGYHLSKHLCDKHAVSIFSKHNLSDLESSLFDVIILCVPDHKIKEVSDSISASETTILHTSGSTSLEALSKHVKRGVIYPLQTFSKERPIDFQSFPFFVESVSTSLETIINFVSSFTNNYKLLSSEERLRLHMAAVFACNFTNHFYKLADDLLKEIGLEFNNLYHLSEETLQKAGALGPRSSQTGPAKRNDQVTLKKHLDLLPDALKPLYRIMTDSIQKSNED